MCVIADGPSMNRRNGQSSEVQHRCTAAAAGRRYFPSASRSGLSFRQLLLIDYEIPFAVIACVCP